MISPFTLSRAPLGLLAVLTLLPHGILARVAIDPLSMQQFTTSFKASLGTGPGGCSRSAPNGASMQNQVLDSLGGANAIAQTVVQDLPTYPTQTYVRGLLFLFFGITFLADHSINPEPVQDNLNAYNRILQNFTAVQQVFVSPNPLYAKPRYKCLEDYASYFQHDVGTDGRENTSAPLIAELLDVRMNNGQLYPGLMYARNTLDGTSGWYPGQQSNPSGGVCGQINVGSNSFVLEFTNAHLGMTPASMNALYGITACPAHFDRDLLLDMGTPKANGGLAEIEKFLEASDFNDLHELIHLVSLAVITDIGAIYPPDGDWTSRAWPQWYFNPAFNERSYGFLRTAYLGLSNPYYARYNADNFANFAGCMYFTELECLGTFQTYIQTKRDLPFQTSLSHKAIKKIRAGKFDLTKDLPMDVDLEQEPGGRAAPEEDDDVAFEFSASPLGDTENHMGRFKDMDSPSAMYG